MKRRLAMSLPNLSALTLTGAGEENPMNVFVTLSEDGEYVFTRVFEQMLGSYSTATFYHSGFCSDVKALSKAFVISKRAGPDLRAYEALYGLFVQRGLIPFTEWPPVVVVNDQGEDVLFTEGAARKRTLDNKLYTETASVYFERVCNEAGAFRDHVFGFIEMFYKLSHVKRAGESRWRQSNRFSEPQHEHLIGLISNMEIFFKQPLLDVWIRDRPFVIKLLMSIPDAKPAYGYNAGPHNGILTAVEKYVRSGDIGRLWDYSRQQTVENTMRRRYNDTVDEKAFWTLYNDDAEVLLLANSGNTLRVAFENGRLTERLMYDLDFIRKLSEKTSGSTLTERLIALLDRKDPNHPALKDYETMINCVTFFPTEFNFSKVNAELRANKEFVRTVFVEGPNAFVNKGSFKLIYGFWQYLPGTLREDKDLVQLAINAFAAFDESKRGTASFVKHVVLSLMRDSSDPCKPYADIDPDALFQFVKGVYDALPTNSRYEINGNFQERPDIATQMICMSKDPRTYEMFKPTLRGDEQLLTFMLEMKFETDEKRRAFLTGCLPHIPNSMPNQGIRDAFASELGE